jgi:hypothetical protein
VEPVAGQKFLAMVAEESRGDGVGEGERLGVDEQICGPRGGRGEH